MGFRPEDLCYRIVVSSCEQVSESDSDQRTITEADWLLLKRERILIAWVPRYKNAWHIKKDIIASSVRDVRVVNKLKKIIILNSGENGLHQTSPDKWLYLLNEKMRMRTDWELCRLFGDVRRHPWAVIWALDDFLYLFVVGVFE